MRDTLAGRMVGGELSIDELGLSYEELNLIDRVYVIACGTSYHAGLIAKNLIERWARIPTEVEVASEFRYRNPIITPSTLVVAVSQSGETADTLAAIRDARIKGAQGLRHHERGGKPCGARVRRRHLHEGEQGDRRRVHEVVLGAGGASLTLLALLLAQTKGKLTTAQVRLLFRELGDTAEQIEGILQDATTIDEAAVACKDAASALFVGRGMGVRHLLRGRAQAQGISYLHAEAYAAGEMKHGPIALIDDGFPVIAVATQSPVYDKLVSNLKECEARGALTVAIATEGDEEIKKVAQHVIYIPKVRDCFTPITASAAVAAVRPLHRAAARVRRGPAAQPGEVGHGRVRGSAGPTRQRIDSARHGARLLALERGSGGLAASPLRRSRTMGRNGGARKDGMARATNREEAEALLASVPAGVDGMVADRRVHRRGGTHEGRARARAAVGARRAFSAQECTFCERHAVPAVPYALRFAAKSAVLKALGIGYEDGVGVRDVEVRLNAKGRPSAALSGAALRRARELGVVDLPLSLSFTHTDAVACALAITRSSQRAAEERVDQKAELARQFKEARALLDEMGAPAEGADGASDAALPGTRGRGARCRACRPLHRRRPRRRHRMKQYGPVELADLLPFPDPFCHKYSRGKLTLLVGSATYPGAASLAALASQRAGAGYTAVYTEGSIVHQVSSLTSRPSWCARGPTGTPSTWRRPSRTARAPTSWAAASTTWTATRPSSRAGF